MPRPFLSIRTCFALKCLFRLTPPFRQPSRIAEARCVNNATSLTFCRRLAASYPRRLEQHQSHPDADETVGISTAETGLRLKDGSEESSESAESADGETKAPQPKSLEGTQVVSESNATSESPSKFQDAFDNKDFRALKELLRVNTPKSDRPGLREITELVPQLDPSYVREHYEVPTKAIYSKMPEAWSPWTQVPSGSAKATIKEICDKTHMPITSEVEFNKRRTLSGGKAKVNRSSERMVPMYWECSMKTEIPEVFQGEAVGEGLTKSIAVEAAWLQILSAMHLEGALTQLLPDLFSKGGSEDVPKDHGYFEQFAQINGTKQSDSRRDHALENDTFAEFSKIDGQISKQSKSSCTDTLENENIAELSEVDEATMKSERNAKLEIYSYAAGLGLIPHFDIQAVTKPRSRHESRSQGSEKDYAASIRLNELGINVRAVAQDVLTAETAAAMLFKDKAEKRQKENASAPQGHYDVLTPTGAKQFWQFYQDQDEGLNLEMEVEQMTEHFSQYKAQLRVNGEYVGEPVMMLSGKEQAKDAAYIVAAVHTARSDPGLLADFKRTFDPANARIDPRPLLPIDAHVDYGQINTMSSALVEAYDKGLPEQRSTPKVVHRLDEALANRKGYRSPVQNERAEKELAKRLAFIKSAKTFEKMRSKKNSLPVNDFRNQIIDMIKNNPYSIISAATGSGKTTQIPQILFDQAICDGSGSLCNIICTQPRRLAAESVARRVAEERGEPLRKTVGYHVRFDPQPPRESYGITYCTTGILLQMLKKERDGVLDSVSHIVIDEIHERSIDIDFLMVILRRAVSHRQAIGKTVPKVVLMSATLDLQFYSEYFRKTEDDGTTTPCPTLELPGRTFAVHKRYLGSIAQDLFRSHGPQVRGVWASDQQSVRFLKAETALSAARSGRIDWRRGVIPKQEEPSAPISLIAVTIAHIVSTTEDGAILVFLPGLRDLLAVQNSLTSKSVLRCDFTDSSKFRIYLLHSSIPREQQAQIFEQLPVGCRRIILSTNIAETSITVPDVKHVVDSGLLNEQRYDQLTRISRLECVWQSKANMKQRAGRAGRVQDGNYYALFCQERAEAFNEVGLPEMRRSDLTGTCLSIKAQDFEGSVKSFLAQAIEPPAKEAVDAAMRTLVDIEALTEGEQITPLGRVLSNIPLHPTMGKMVVLGVIFRCLDPMIILGTTAAEAGLFVDTPETRSQAREKRRNSYAGEMQSDHLAMLGAIKELRSIKQQQGERAVISRAAENFLNLGVFRSIEATGSQIERLLIECNLLRYADLRSDTSKRVLGGKDLNTNSDNAALIKCLLLAGLKPNLAAKRTPRRGVFRTSTEDSARITSGSINREKDDLIHPYGTLLAYNTLTRSNGALMLRDSTVVTPIMAALFGGHLKVDKRGDLLVDGWLPFRLDWHDRSHASKLILEYRKALDMVLFMAFDALSGLYQRESGNFVDDPVRDHFVRSVVKLLQY